MVNKALFGSAPRGERAKPTEDRNEAGGLAYRLDAKQALSRLMVTGCLSDVFYADAEDQLDSFKKLAAEVDCDFLGKVAVYAREQGRMKDAPALACALLSNRGADGNRVLDLVFSRVVGNAKMLRNYVTMIRSGKFGRKSLGAANRRRLRAWFAARSPEALFKQSAGDPSMRDLLRLIRPASREDKQRSALYDYFLGKPAAEKSENLPQLVKDFEAWKDPNNPRIVDTPDLPLMMLTGVALPKAAKKALWTSLARTMSWWALRMNLATLARNECFEDAEITKLVAARLGNREEVLKSGNYPYQILAAYKAAMSGTHRLPNPVLLGLHAALDLSTENMVTLAAKRVVVAVDVSGSMNSPITGKRKGSTTNMNCREVAALVAMCAVRRSADCRVVAFGQNLAEIRIDPAVPALTMAEKLGELNLGGTDCSLPFVWLNQEKVDADLVILVSDDQSWIDDRAMPGTHGFQQACIPGSPVKAQEGWNEYRSKHQDAKLVCLNLQPYETSQLVPSKNTLCIGGWSDSVFDAVNRFVTGDFKADAFVEEIERVDLKACVRQTENKTEDA